MTHAEISEDMNALNELRIAALSHRPHWELDRIECDLAPSLQTRRPQSRGCRIACERSRSLHFRWFPADRGRRRRVGLIVEQRLDHFAVAHG